MQLRKAKRKVIPKTKRSKKAHTVIEAWDRSLVDMRLFFRNTNWAEMWEEFYLAVDEHGGWLYKNLNSFVVKKAESMEQRRFMYWWLGGSGEQHPQYSAIVPSPHLPVDWAQKRQDGGWKSDQNVRDIENEVNRQVWAMDALRSVGNKLTVKSIIRAGRLAQQLDEATRGQLFLPNAPLAVSVKRAKDLLEIYNQIQALEDRAVQTYAKCHGVNFDDMSGLVHLMEASVLAGKTVEGKVVETSREQKALALMMKMATEKAAVYKMPLPPDAEQAIVDVMKEEEAEVVKATAKKKVQ